jgi:hypothetical protein
MSDKIFFRFAKAGTVWADTSAPVEPNCFVSVQKIASDAGINLSKPSEDYMSISCDSSHPSLIPVVRALREGGWNLSPLYLIPEERNRRRLIHATITQTFTKTEMDLCEYLRVDDWGKGDLMMRYPETRDGLIVAHIERFGEETGQGWKSRSGIIRDCMMAVNDEVKRELEAAGLIGLGFLPILWDEPERAKGAYWQFRPSLTMPPSLTPIHDCGTWQEFADGPYKPAVLRYRSADLKPMGEFDIAITHEMSSQVAKKPHSLFMERYQTIVSQRFRQACIKLKLPAKYIPVRLDAPAPELPWFYHPDTPPPSP